MVLRRVYAHFLAWRRLNNTDGKTVWVCARRRIGSGFLSPLDSVSQLFCLQHQSLMDFGILWLKSGKKENIIRKTPRHLIILVAQALVCLSFSFLWGINVSSSWRMGPGICSEVSKFTCLNADPIDGVRRASSGVESEWVRERSWRCTVPSRTWSALNKEAVLAGHHLPMPGRPVCAIYKLLSLWKLVVATTGSSMRAIGLYVQDSLWVTLALWWERERHRNQPVDFYSDRKGVRSQILPPVSFVTLGWLSLCSAFGKGVFWKIRWMKIPTI